VVSCDSPLGCAMPLEVMISLTGDRARDTYDGGYSPRNRPLIRLCPRVIDHKMQSERLRRDVTCEHGALQQRAASDAPLDQAARVLSADACRCCAGKFSIVTGATGEAACVKCGAGESWMPQARHVMPSYPI
jgi:hypothetical protein